MGGHRSLKLLLIVSTLRFLLRNTVEISVMSVRLAEDEFLSLNLVAISFRELINRSKSFIALARRARVLQGDI